jgi:hypothetical protein
MGEGWTNLGSRLTLTFRPPLTSRSRSLASYTDPAVLSNKLSRAVGREWELLAILLLLKN